MVKARQAVAPSAVRELRRGTNGTPERVAEVLRGRIAEGVYAPGERLSEEALAETFGVSRNTLREAFRLLSRERLIVLVFNRGASVRVLDADDVRDLYRVRRMLECAAIREFAAETADLTRTDCQEALTPLWAAVRQAERAASNERWSDVATSDLQFHQALTALAGSPRGNELTQRLMAELRLAFSMMSGAPGFHLPFLQRNRVLVEQLERGEYDAAEAELAAYLREAERELLTAYDVED
jgi:DNA-binding GntR family transcriptional regulator